jgi:hypothetical protein
MYEIRADDVVLKSNLKDVPNQAEVDRLAVAADRRGWNGTTLDLFKNGQPVCELFPSDEAKAQYK